MPTCRTTIRLNDALTVNVGLRYEYATPQCEANNVLSNFDPVDLAMIPARDGSVEDRSTIQPDRNNFAPRLGFAWSVTPSTVVRGGYGLSYVHFQRAGGGNILAINGPQVINAVSVQNDPTAADVPHPAGWLPGGWTDASNFNPVAANITYMPNDYRSSRVESWYVSVQRELFRSTIVDVAYVGNRPTACSSLPTTTRRVPTLPARTCRCRRGGRSRRSATSPTRGTAADPTTTASSSRPRRGRAASTSSTR